MLSYFPPPRRADAHPVALGAGPHPVGRDPGEEGGTTGGVAGAAGGQAPAQADRWVGAHGVVPTVVVPTVPKSMCSDISTAEVPASVASAFADPSRHPGESPAAGPSACAGCYLLLASRPWANPPWPRGPMGQPPLGQPPLPNWATLPACWPPPPFKGNFAWMQMRTTTATACRTSPLSRAPPMTSTSGYSTPCRPPSPAGQVGLGPPSPAGQVGVGPPSPAGQVGVVTGGSRLRPTGHCGRLARWGAGHPWLASEAASRPGCRLPLAGRTPDTCLVCLEGG